jgi:integrase
MARIVGRLTARKVATARPPKGRDSAIFSDGGNLFLQVTTGRDGHIRRSWTFRFERFGQRHELGLGPLSDRSLAEARDRARTLRQGLRDGIDPFEAKQEAKRAALAARAEQAKAVTFRECADRCFASHADGWKSAKHRAEWRSTLEIYAHPTLGDLAVRDIETAHVVAVLEPIWKSKPETASRLRGRIEKVLGWATVREFRSGDNPARWRGHLAELFPSRGKVRKIKHHAAMPFTDVPAFMADLRKRSGTAARAFEFLILTASRSGEVMNASWPEFDLASKVWIVPASRMKAGREHRVPLSERAIAILRDMQSGQPNDLVFPGRRGSVLRDKSFTDLLGQLGRGDFTAHGFRSAFRDWVAERTNFPNIVSEMALAHAVGSKVEAAYRRGDLFEKRRKLMQAWSDYCARPVPTGATVTQFPARAGNSGPRSARHLRA